MTVEIDDRVRSKGRSFLRQLRGCDLTRMSDEENLYIIRGQHQEPAMVMVPYATYLKLQEDSKCRLHGPQ